MVVIESSVEDLKHEAQQTTVLPDTNEFDVGQQLRLIRKGIVIHDPECAGTVERLLMDFESEPDGNLDIISLLEKMQGSLSNYQFKDAMPILDQTEKLMAEINNSRKEKI